MQAPALGVWKEGEDGATEQDEIVVVEVGENSFTVSLIPETLARTTLGFKQPGDPVNLEVDVIAKTVVAYLRAMGESPQGTEAPRRGSAAPSAASTGAPATRLALVVSRGELGIARTTCRPLAV